MYLGVEVSNMCPSGKVNGAASPLGLVAGFTVGPQVPLCVVV